ncbi:MAG: TonB-dependent receptor, partial [Bacteroidetes bacterium]|nr:TonB-dependent receptor [Bacteroidota bacterium]
NGAFPLINTQYNADFVFGGRLVVPGDFIVTPEIRLLSAKYYPVFFSAPANASLLSYAGKATITSFRVTGKYSAGGFSSELALQYQKGTADSLSSMPNLPPFDANLRLTYDITPEFAARAEFLYLSFRYSDLALANRLDPVGLLNIRFSYRFSISKLPLEVFAGGENVLNQKYFIWQGYQEFPLTLYIGLSRRIL